MAQLTRPEATRLDLVFRASVRDPDDRSEPMRFPVYKQEDPTVANPAAKADTAPPADPPEAVHTGLRAHPHRHDNGVIHTHAHLHMAGAGDHDLAPHPHGVVAKAEGAPTAANPDPDGDGDDDTSPVTDTDHDYWNADGTPTAKGLAAGFTAAQGRADLKKAEAPMCPLCKGTGTIRQGHMTCPDCHGTGTLTAKAELSTEEVNDLPDSDFAYIEPGGEKDAEGKTTPRAKRHFPIPDAAHASAALGRAQGGQSPFAAKAMPKILAATKRFKVGEFAKSQEGAALRMALAAAAASPDGADVSDAVTSAITELATIARADAQQGVTNMADGTEPTPAAGAPPTTTAPGGTTPPAATADPVAKGDQVAISKAEYDALTQRVEKAEAVARHEADLRLGREFQAKAEELMSHSAADKVAVAKALREVSEKSPEALAVLEQVLKSQNEGLRQSAAFRALGSDAPGRLAGADGAADSAWSAIQTRATEIAKAETGLSPSQARSRAMREMPDQAAVATRTAYGPAS